MKHERGGTPITDEDAVNLLCAYCGTINTVTESLTAPAIEEHFTVVHPGVTPIPRRNFAAIPALLRCDTCNVIAEPPWWEHLCTPPLEDTYSGIIDNDGRWLACDTCHGLVIRRDLTGLLRRHWSVAVEQTPSIVTLSTAKKGEMRARLARRYRVLFQRFDAGTRQYDWDYDGQ